MNRVLIIYLTKFSPRYDQMRPIRKLPETCIFEVGKARARKGLQAEIYKHANEKEKLGVGEEIPSQSNQT